MLIKYSLSALPFESLEESKPEAAVAFTALPLRL
jgi:hypothetical protein